MSFSSHEFILTSSPDGPIMVYEASTGATVACFTSSRSPRCGLTLVGQELIAASHVFDTGSGSIHIYNWYASTMFQSIPVPEPVAPIISTSDGAYLFAGGLSGSIHSFSLPSGDVIKSFAVHSKPISCLRLSDDESLVISGSDDGTIAVIPAFRLVESNSTEEDPKDLVLHQWKAHSDSVTAFNFGIGLCNSTLVSSSMDCTCKFWSLVNNGVLTRTAAFPCPIFGIAIDLTESEFYAAGDDGLIYKGSMKVGSTEVPGKAYELITWPKSHGGSIVSLVLVNEGKNLVSAAEDGSVLMWDVEKGEVALVLGNNMGRISDMIVAKTTGYGVRNIRNAAGKASAFTSGICDEEIIRTLNKITEVGDVMSVVIEDKKRAIDMLESAIGMYERLLELILKEAMKGISRTVDEEEDKKEEEDDEKEDK